MIEISYEVVFIAITLLWVLLRVFFNIKKGKADLKYEAQLISLYICIVVIVRITFFPWHLVEGHIQPLIFDAEELIPLKLNLVPIVHLFDIYDGWAMNLFGNIAMFIPLGFVLPLCFNKLDRLWKAVFVGFSCSLFIELIQLLFFERTTDIDDLITNTTGALIGAGIYFSGKYIFKKMKTYRHK